MIEGIAVFGGSAAVIAFLKGCKDIILKWMDGRARRSVLVKYRGVEIRINGAVDLEDVIAQLPEPPAIAPGRKRSP